MQFQNPPIVELVVELKWAADGANPVPAGIPEGMPYPVPANSAHDKFLADFQQLAAESGWKRSERLVPLGFPYLRFQPVLRIRSDDPNRSSILLQVGQGVFSVHALRPYQNWEAFWPVAQEGIGLLLRARIDTEKQKPFFRANVMYINVFEEDIVGELNVRQFLEGILGFGLSLPTAIKRQALNENQIDLQLSLKIPLQDGLEMQLNIGGTRGWGDRKGIPMNTVVSSQESVPPELESISAVFDSAHLAIRNTFVGLTQKVHSKMVPVGESL